MSGEGTGSEGRREEIRPLRPEPPLAALVGSGVAFVVIGGYAVAAHGFPRATKAIDICPEPGEDNLARLAGVLAELEATPVGLEEFEGEFDLEPDLEGLKMGGNWALMTRHGRLDVMQRFAFEGIESEGGYADLNRHAVERTFLGHLVRFCSYEDLVRMKRATGRAQDSVDLESLRAARGEL